MRTQTTFVLIAAICLIAPHASKGQQVPTEINFFNGSYAEALAKAKAEDKLIFIDAYTRWCGPCKMLAQNTFTDKKVAEYFNEHFICLSVDMEHGEGPKLADKYKVNHYPTLIITDQNGNRITFTVGYIIPDDMLGFGKYGVQRASLD